MCNLIKAILAVLMILFTIGCTLSPVEKMSRNKKNRAGILSELIQANGLSGLPSEFVIEDSSRIACSQIINEKDELLTLAAVSYDVSKLGSGKRTYIFVFNSAGKCLFHSPDGTPTIINDNHPSDMYFCDMTGDGNIEKLVSFDLYETGKIKDSFESFRRAIQVWRISNDNPELLLEVHYRVWDDEHKLFIDPGLSWPISKGDPPVVLVGEGIPDITLEEHTKKPLVTFRWSPKNKKFEWQSDSSVSWKIVYSIAQQTSGTDGV